MYAQITASLGVGVLAEEKSSHKPNVLVSMAISESGQITCSDALEACEEALDAADRALEAKDKVIEAQNDIIETRAKQAEELAKRVGELESQRDSIFRNPWVMLLTGALIGGTVVGIVQKF